MTARTQNPANGRELSRLLRGAGGGVIVRVFALMKIAEDEILAAKRRAHSPEARERVRNVFGHLAPPAGMSVLADWVYRAHARELLDRALAGQDLRPATKSAVMLALMHGSLKAPLTQDYAALYERLFCATAPTELCIDFDATPRGSYEGAVDEIYRDMRRKFAVEDRSGE